MKIAVFYHCRISGPGIPDKTRALEIVREQMESLKKSGLEERADEIHVGINGDESDALLVSTTLADKCNLYVHGSQAKYEFPTLAVLQEWLRPGWAVLYHHSKGVTQPKDYFHHHHRRVMEDAVVFKWRRCINDLRWGFDAVGVNLVDPRTRPICVGRFFGGNFWWARSNYLLTLPRLPDHGEVRIECEGWVGRSAKPRMMDYERPYLYK